MRSQQENVSLPGILGNLGANSDFTEHGKGLSYVIRVQPDTWDKIPEKILCVSSSKSRNFPLEDGIRRI